MPSSFSMHQLLTVARPHHTRWVRVGTVVVLLGYVAAASSQLLSNPNPFPQVFSDLGAVALCAVASLVAWRGRSSAAVILVVGTMWTELHATVFMSGELKGSGLAVLPGFVAGAGILAGGPTAVVVALVTSVSIPSAVLLGTWLRTGHASLGTGDITTVIVLAAALVGIAVVVHLGLASFGQVLERSREDEQRVSELVRNAPDGIVSLDAEGRLESLNPAARRILGVEEDAARGRRFAELLAALSTGGVDAVGSLLSGAAESATLLLRHEGAEELTVELSARRTTRADGTPGAQATLRDVTYRVRAEEDRRRFEHRLQHAQRLEAVGQLAGGVAHDFNNLLQAMLGNLELLKLEIDAAHPGHAYAVEIERAARRGGDLIRNLLTFARKGIVDPEIVDINEIARDLDPMLRRLIPADIELAIAPAPELWRVRVDPGQFEQVVVNLALNARDAMPNGGRLTIATTNAVLAGDEASALGLVPGEYVRMTVADTGTGMSSEVLARVFEPFFTTKTHGKGTGLGLATCFGIVAQAEGHIGVRSAEGTGTTFEVLLPRVAAEDSAPPRASSLEPAAVIGGHETVLLVEDEEAVRSVMARSLAAQGYRVLTAASGEEAILVSRACDGPIHLLLSDVVLPGMGGKETASQLAADRPGMAVLFSSGYAEDAIVHRGVLEDGLEFLGKPYTLSDLALRVRAILDRRQPSAVSR